MPKPDSPEKIIIGDRVIEESLIAPSRLMSKVTCCIVFYIFITEYFDEPIAPCKDTTFPLAVITIESSNRSPTLTARSKSY